MARAPARWRNTLLVLTMIPFWTNFLVRTLALMFVLRSDGPINGLLMAMGLIPEPLPLLFTQNAVILGLVYGELPFMILPLYATLERFDFSLVEAAQDLGANEWHAFRRVIWPLTLPGSWPAPLWSSSPPWGLHHPGSPGRSQNDHDR
jgi:spermidine/putrescine transport system permease protein